MRTFLRLVASEGTANCRHKQKSHLAVAFYLAETEKFGPSTRYSLQTLSSRQMSEAIELIGKQ